jgi:phage-related protein
MAVNWPTLSLKPHPSSRIKFENNIDKLLLGDGYALRYAKGINNLKRTYTIVYQNLSSVDTTTLIAFLKANSLGQSIAIPLWPEDPSGSTTGYFMIDTFDFDRGEGVLANFSIECTEVFTS